MPDQPLVTMSTDDSPMRCPRCRSDKGLHFDEVTLIDPAGDVVPLHAAGSEGLSVVTAAIGNGEAPGRRHLVVLPHWCGECGERGEIVLRQQGGQTFSQYREVSPSPS